jgi:TP901 family phage tail tape measure protein
VAGPVRIAILANGSQAKRELNSVQRSLGGFSTAGRLGMAGVAALATGVVAFGVSAVNVEKKFSTSMRLIQASTGATSDEIKQLNDLAIQLGQDTSFSAGEAADAMLELAKAGLTTKQIMGGGVAGTLTLAAAGGTDLATAATIAANAMNTFNLRGRDMDKIAAALAGGANASTASVESLGQALQQVGPGATNAGLSLQETVAALAAFDAQGIKGSDAGTSLKTMLTRLVPQTDKAANAMRDAGLDFTKANGEFVSLTEIAGQLRAGLSELSDEERTRALNAIFGSDATRAATALMREGEDGIRSYIKATKDQNAAQELAAARMGGTEGALEKLSGSIETAKLRLGQELAPAVVKGADLLDDKLVPALEGGIQAGKDIGKALAPAAEEIVEALRNIAGEGDSVGGFFNGVLIPAISVTAETVGALVNFVDELPGPVKDFGIQVGLAALALGPLNSGLLTAQGRLAGFTANMSTAAGRTAFLASTAKTAAGIGGLLLLTNGFSKTAEEGASMGSVLQGVAGGAGIGAMFGPIGALVGAGVGGGLIALTGAFAETEDEARAARLELQRSEGFKAAKEDADALRDALSGVVNQYGKVTRAAVESSFTGDDGKLDADVQALRDLGVSMDTIVSATLGQRDAVRIVNGAMGDYRSTLEQTLASAEARWNDVKDGIGSVVTATGQVEQRQLPTEQVDLYEKEWKDAKDALEEFTNTQDIFDERVNGNTAAIEDHREQMALLAEALGISVKQYKQFPDKVRTKFEAEGLVQTGDDAFRLINRYKGLQTFNRIRAVVSAPGVELTARQVLKLQDRYKLNPEQVRTLFKQEGIPTSLRSIAKLTKQMRSTPKEIRSIIKLLDLDVSARDVIDYQDELDKVDKKKPNPKLSADDKQLQEVLRAAVHDVQNLDRQTASPKANIDRSSIPADVAWVNAALNGIPDEYVNVYLNRVNLGGNNGGDRDGTPRELPRLLGDPGAIEIEAEKTGALVADALLRGIQKAAERKGKNVLAKILASVIGGTDGVSTALEKITRLIEKRINLKDDKKESAREKAVLKHLRDEYDALRRNARAQDEINRKLERARQHLQEVRAWVDQVKQSFIETGNITQLGVLDDGTVSADLLLDQLRDKVARAERFAELIRELSDDVGPKLSKTALDQLLAAGPEAGLAAAEALANGGDAAIDEINDLTDRLGDVGQSLGGQLSDQFFDVGLQAAQGLVDGLEAKQKDLDRIAKRLARQLAQAVRKALGIKSPSKVFQEIGDQTMKGLSIGLDETYATKAGTATADALIRGFGTPALDAFTTSKAAKGITDVNVNLTIKGDALDDLRAGKTITRRVQAGRASGVRRLAVGPR